jgi:cbb3-type cytochrome oxidase subunit 3
MFKQFLENAEGNQGYLLSSLAIFLIFFILVGVFLLTMKKDDINYMSQLPLKDEDDERGS